MESILVLGPTYIDTTITTASNLQWQGQVLDISTKSLNRHRALGGTGLSYATALSHLGNTVSFSTIVGDKAHPDCYAFYSHLKNSNITAMDIQHTEGMPIDEALVIIDSEGSKLAIVDRKVTPGFQLRPQYVNDKHIVITSFEPKTISTILQSLLPTLQVVVFAPNFNLAENSTQYISEIKKHKVDILTLSAREFAAMQQHESKIASYIKVIAVTAGDKGCSIYFQGRVYRLPAYPDSIKNPANTNGAGEAFGSGFVSYLCRINKLTWTEADVLNAYKVGSLYASKHIMQHVHLFPKIRLDELITETAILDKQSTYAN